MLPPTGARATVVSRQQTLKLHTLTARVLATRTAKTLSSTDTAQGLKYGPSTANGEYLVVTLKLTNNMNTPQTFSPDLTQTVLSSDQAIYTESDNGEGALDTSFRVKESTIQPGEAEVGTVVFDVPPARARVGAGTDLFVGNFGDDLTAGMPATLGVITLGK